MSISEYFFNAIARIKSAIEQEPEDYLLNVDAEELSEYYTQKYGLPLIEKDEGRKIAIKPLKSRRASTGGRVPVRIYYPINPKENLQTVIKRNSSTRFAGGFHIQLQGDCLVSDAEVLDLEKYIENMEKLIAWKNNDVRGGNESIRSRIKTYIENKQKVLKQKYERLESIIEKVKIPLVVKKEEPRAPIVDFSVKEELKTFIKPVPKKRKESILDRDSVISLIGYIRNSCLSFEITPEVFSKHSEEELRNIILGQLNAISGGGATGETFNKLGQTDISLRVANGNVLIIECKYWGGKKNYLEGISQLFRYLTWRQNYGILVTFVRRRSFTKVIRKAKEATQEHETFMSFAMHETGESEFITEHRFPDDPEKRVEIYHLLFNLFAR